MLKSTYAPLPPLPPGWTQHKAPSGHFYYYNSETKESTYARPQAKPDSVPNSTLEISQDTPFLSPDTLPLSSSTHYGILGEASSHSGSHVYHAGGFRGGKGYQDRKRQYPVDRPKTKHQIPGCTPWLLVKTRLGRRFAYNPELNESFWRFPQEILNGVAEYDRMQEEMRGTKHTEQSKEQNTSEAAKKDTAGQHEYMRERLDGESDEYEMVEVTESEEEESLQPKRPKTNGDGDQQEPFEFTEDDIGYQLTTMGEEYGFDKGEYDELGEGSNEEGVGGLALTEEDSAGLFRELLDDYHINPYSTWEKVIEEGNIIEDSRYTVLSSMRARRDVWSVWSRDRIQQLKQQKERQVKEDPRIQYLAFLEDFATPKLYWPEFKRKYRKEPEMKDSQLPDRDREKLYRDLISRLKLSESARKSDLSSLLKSIPLQDLNRSSHVKALPLSVTTDLRYVSLAPKVRDPLIETYISTLAPAPEREDMTDKQQDELNGKKAEHDRHVKALAERERQVARDKRRWRDDMVRGKYLLREGEAELEKAMQI